MSKHVTFLYTTMQQKLNKQRSCVLDIQKPCRIMLAEDFFRKSVYHYLSQMLDWTLIPHPCQPISGGRQWERRKVCGSLVMGEYQMNCIACSAHSSSQVPPLPVVSCSTVIQPVNHMTFSTSSLELGRRLTPNPRLEKVSHPFLVNKFPFLEI